MQHEPAATTPEAREAFYDAEIAPELLKLGKKCQDHGLSFIALVEWGNREDHGRTCAISKDASAHFRWVEAATRCKAAGGSFNVDAFMFGMARDTLSGRSPHSSVVMSQMGIDPDPAKRSATRLEGNR
jgi:hypothetical protein